MQSIRLLKSDYKFKLDKLDHKLYDKYFLIKDKNVESFVHNTIPDLNFILNHLHDKNKFLNSIKEQIRFDCISYYCNDFENEFILKCVIYYSRGSWQFKTIIDIPTFELFKFIENENNRK